VSGGGFRQTLRRRFPPANARARMDAGLPPAPGAQGKKVAVRPKAAGSPSSNGNLAASRPELAKRRRELSRKFVELQWDLGGVAYEMASRDHFRLDVLMRQAAKLQQVDAELGQLERMLKMEKTGAAGTCPNCSALQAHGAVFCWQCGQELKAATKAGGEGA
jgi:hypothetical protein